MTEKLPKPEKLIEKEVKTPDSKEALIESEIKKAKLLYSSGDIDEAIDMLEDALAQAHEAGNEELYDDIVALMDEWEE